MSLSKLAVYRLTKLANYMQALPKSADKHFDMNAWFWHNDKHDHGFKSGQPITRHDLTLCGTTACAMGWAATIPAFNQAGLKVDQWGSLSILPGRFFDITDFEAHRLFFDFGIKTPKEWARRCHQFIKDKK